MGIGTFSIASRWRHPAAVGALWAVGTALLLAPGVRAQTTFGPSAGGPFIIPDDNPAGVSSTITVGASSNFVLAFNSVTITNLTHTWMSDLTATLTHGSTTVTLFANPGDSTDFNGTYTFAAGGANLNTTAAGLTGAQAIPSGTYAPLQSLSVFNNSSIAGGWTLKVVDDAAVDVGQFTSFQFNANVGSLPPLEIYDSTAGNPIPINDATLNIATNTITPGITTSNIVVADNFTIGDFQGLAIDNFMHTLAGDLRVQLIHVDTGTSVDIVNRLGRLGAADNFDFGDDSNFNGQYRFRDTGASLLAAAQQGNSSYDIPSGTYARSTSSYPEGADTDTFKAFVGESVGGTWQLRITDASPGDVGNFLRWGFSATQAVVPEPSSLCLMALPLIVGGIALRRRRVTRSA